MEASGDGKTLWTICKYYILWWVWVAPSYWSTQVDVQGDTLFPLFLLISCFVASYALLTSKYKSPNSVKKTTRSSSEQPSLGRKVTFGIGSIVAYIAVSASGFVVFYAIYPADPYNQLVFEDNREVISIACIMTFSVFLGQGSFWHFLIRLFD